jgi:hypothetical protein
MVNPLDALIDKLAEEAAVWHQRARQAEEEAATHRHAADLLEARIHGIQEARAALGIAPGGNGAEPPPRKRRNIRQMVLDLVNGEVPLTTEEMAQRIGCRPSQVRHVIASVS